MQKQLKVMQSRVQQTNKEEIYNSPKKTPIARGLKEKHSTSTEVHVGSSQPSGGETAAEIMRQMKSGSCGEVINQLTTHEQIKMVHGIMETQKRQLEGLKDEVQLISKFFAGDQPKKQVVPPLPKEMTFGKPQE